MRDMEEVNHNNRKRRYGARDKGKIVFSIMNLHEKGYSQDLCLSSIKEVVTISKELYKYGDLKLLRKYEKFSSLDDIV